MDLCNLIIPLHNCLCFLRAEAGIKIVMAVKPFYILWCSTYILMLISPFCHLQEEADYSWSHPNVIKLKMRKK